MKIHLPSIKTFVYTTEDNRHKRQENIKTMMEKLNFTDWCFVFGSVKDRPYWKNMTSDYIKIFSENTTPFLLLEDDVTVTEFYKDDIEIPNEAELVYLGGTTNAEKRDNCRIIEKGKKLGVNIVSSKDQSKNWSCNMLYSEYDENYIRVYNMHSTHAVLFVNEKIKKYIIKSIIDTHNNEPVDMTIAKNMQNFVTCCVKYPLWYQNDGHNNNATLYYYKMYK